MGREGGIRLLYEDKRPTQFDKGCIVAAKPIARSFPEIVFVMVIHVYNKRSKNVDKTPNRRQKIRRRSQDRGKAVDNGLSRCCFQA